MTTDEYDETYRPSGEFFTKNEANLQDFLEYLRKSNSSVKTITFDTTPEEEAKIAANIEESGRTTGGFCAFSISSVLKGTGPFKDLGTFFSPGSLADELEKLE